MVFYAKKLKKRLTDSSENRLPSFDILFNSRDERTFSHPLFNFGMSFPPDLLAPLFLNGD
ncbi:hypothetical protein FC25_GL000178 [Ligilactobacillus ruminis DSM 20403 = NBRC 102161]|nr:hypothetical protein FC25_GL000178 [Ligilactobacillus ruminis DSM 20403 = NBRC 102161]